MLGFTPSAASSLSLLPRGTRERLTPELPALPLLATGTYYCYKSHAGMPGSFFLSCWVAITGKGMPLLWDLGHFLLTSLPWALADAQAEILVTRTLILLSPIPALPPSIFSAYSWSSMSLLPVPLLSSLLPPY